MSLEPDDRIGLAVHAHDDLAELLRVAQAPYGIHLHLECCAGRRGRLPDLAAGDLNVLFLDDVLYIDSGDAEARHLVRIKPDAHRVTPLAKEVDVADARQRA